MALSLLERIVVDEKIDLIIGTSMGGMFAQKFRGRLKILINPAFHVSSYMRSQLGVHAFLNPRKDGADCFEITSFLCDLYESLESFQFNNIDNQEKSLTYALFGDEDELINCQPEYSSYYTNFSKFRGEHRLNEQVIRNILIPLIEELRQNEF